MLFTHGFQRLADQRPVGRIVIAQQRLVQAALFVTLRHHHILTLIANLTQRVLAGVIHGGRVRQRRRIEVLHLIQAETMLFKPQRQIHHIFIPRAGVGGNKVWDQILLFTGLLRIGIKQLLKAIVAAHTRLHHFRQRSLFRMLRGNLQIAANVVGSQLFDIARVFNGDVVTYAGSDEDLFDAFQVTGAAIEINRRLVVGVHMRADIRINA